MRFNRRRIFAGLFAEVSFTALPLLIVLMVLLNYERGEHIVKSPEWSFGAAILFGQALVKFVTGMAHGGRAARGPVSLAITLIIVLGLAPSLLVLTLVLMNMENTSHQEPAEWLSALQVVLFLAGAATYLLFGAIGELWRHHETIAVVDRGPNHH